MAIISEQNKVGYGSIDPSSTLSDVDEQVGLLAPSSVPFETRRKDDKRRMSVMVMAGLGAFALLGLFACSNNSTATPTALENREASLTKSLESTMMGAPHVDPATTDMLNTPKKNDPTKRVYFTQIIDHNNPTTSGTFQQGYYENYNHWRGPGHPIFFLLGGEDAITGIAYPFISEILAEKYGAYTFEAEHRYFGESYPVKNYTKQDIATQLTLRQTLQDALTIVHAKQKLLGCGPRGTPTYCPVMAVGGSYSAFLAMLIRLEYPEVVDMAYAAGNPLTLYDHKVSPYTYYEYITKVAEQISPGCPKAVHEALVAIKADLESIPQEELLKKVQEYNVCPKLPKKIKTGKALAEAIIHFTSDKFGEYNMWYYPPSPNTVFAKGCSVFKNETQSVQERVKSFFSLMNFGSTKCHDFAEEEEGDDLWSAVCCYIIPQIGKSNETMWFPAKYSLKDNIRECKDKFGIDLDLNYLDKEFHLEKNLERGTRILLTNGMNDGWYATSQTEPIPGSGIVVKNFVTGSHHSELAHKLGVPDTPEIAQAHVDIAELIGKWLQEAREEGSSS